MQNYYARDNETLKEHLLNVANLASAFGKDFEISNTTYTLGLLHDLGKYTAKFQDYLEKSLNRDEGVRRGDVVHAFQGAKFLKEKISQPTIFELLANVIEAHHGGLFDGIDALTKPVMEKLKRDDLDFEEAKTAFLSELQSVLPDFNLVQDEMIGFVRNVISKIQNNENRNDQKEKEAFFQLHLLTKFLFSCLVDADRFDAGGEDVINEIQKYKTAQDWSFFINKLEACLSSFSNDTPLNKVRKKISDSLALAGDTRECGTYSLCVPTGAGKTLSSLRFALHHAKKHHKKRIIYVIPYLSIIDQTAKIFKDIFSCDNIDSLILEHHSNFECEKVDKRNDEGTDYNLLSSRWDAPIVITTMVQFLETIYSNKGSKLRKFHNMSDAVIIFDEVQSIPIKCLNLFNAVVNFLNLFAKSSAILCTATEPNLSKTKHPVFLNANSQLITLSREEENVFERVNLIDKIKRNNTPYTVEELFELVEVELQENKNTLIIFNTKQTAKNFYFECEKSGLNFKKFFLSTDLCPQHRLNILSDLRDALTQNDEEPVLCISTQLIEAGVDISFDTVFRIVAPMDSIVQASGRCNRNGENTTKSAVYIVNVENENLSRLPEIEIGSEITERVLRENAGKLTKFKPLLDYFYTYYYAEKNIESKMDYELKEGNKTLYELLNTNYSARETFSNGKSEKYEGLPCAFETASDNFSVIDEGRVGLVVPYADADDLVQEYINIFQEDFKAKKKVLRKIERYTVSVYPWIIEKLSEAHAVSIVRNNKKDAGGFYYLSNPTYYDKDGVGLKLEANLEFMAF